MTTNKRGPIQLSASVACIHPFEYREKILELDAHGIDSFHLDICDGHFAPTFLLNFQVIAAMRKITRKRIDVHLYCTHPSKYLAELAACGTDLVIVHQESREDLGGLVSRILAHGLIPGMAILPDSDPTHEFLLLLDRVKMVVANMVGPAFAGQPFDARGLQNLRYIYQEVLERNLDIELAADGNVGKKNLPDLLEAGANHLVCGTTSIFKQNGSVTQHLQDFRQSIELFRQNA